MGGSSGGGVGVGWDGGRGVVGGGRGLVVGVGRCGGCVRGGGGCPGVRPRGLGVFDCDGHFRGGRRGDR